MTQMSLREGDVLQYETREDVCREGLALVRRDPTQPCGYVAVDTYWQHHGLDPEMNDGHVLSGAEVESATVLFNASRYVQLHSKPGQMSTAEQWRQYRPEDRECVTAKHGERVVYLVKREAVPAFRVAA